MARVRKHACTRTHRHPHTHSHTHSLTHSHTHTHTQIAEGVQHLHSEGALHLDLKPDNVMVSVPDSFARFAAGPVVGGGGGSWGEGPGASLALADRVVCQLCDWELSSTFDADGRSAGGGTPGFWSPEQVLDIATCIRVCVCECVLAYVHLFVRVCVCVCGLFVRVCVCVCVCVCVV